MLSLPASNPNVHPKFEQGFHLVRRTNKFWCGIGSDLTIEQTLMRSLKMSGGLTPGSGIDEKQRAVWSLCAPVAAEYSMALQDLTNKSFTTSSQLQSLSTSAIERDSADFCKLDERLKAFDSILNTEAMINVCTGVEATPDVNVHEFERVGNVIIAKMIDHNVYQYSFSRAGIARTIASNSKVKVGDQRSIDPALLFQRFWLTSNINDLSAREVLEYELCPCPPALFESPNLMKKADKAPLLKSLKRQAGVEKESRGNILVEHYVLDGDSLLRRLPWKNGQTYGAIANMYGDFISRSYGQATLVFDGYPDGPTIKDRTHNRRYSKSHATVQVSSDAVFVGQRDEFLSNPVNKSRIQKLIGDQATNYQ